MRAKKIVSALLVLCMLLTLLPVSAFAADPTPYTGTDSSSASIGEYVKLSLLRNADSLTGLLNLKEGSNLVADGFYSKDVAGYIQEGTTGTTDADGKWSEVTTPPYYYVYRAVSYPLIGVTASNSKTYALTDTLDQSDFKVVAWYSDTLSEIPTEITTDNAEHLYCVTITNTDAWSIPSTAIPEEVGGKRTVTVTYDTKTCDVTLKVAEPQPEAINAVTLAVTAPVKDAEPAVVASAPTNTSFTYQRWLLDSTEMESGAKFAAGKTYQYETLLTAADASTGNNGFVFGDSLAVTIEGADDVDVQIGSKVSGYEVSDDGGAVKYAKITATFTVPGDPYVPVDPTTGTKPYNKDVNSAAIDLSTCTSRTLASGVYFMNGNCTFNGNAAAPNGLTIANDATVYIYLNGYTLTANGKAGTTAVPGGAGIALPEGANLYFVGEGTVNANGGKGGRGAAGSTGGSSSCYIIDKWPSTSWGIDATKGEGGEGGAGGAGAGAGIGTAGSATTDAPATAIGNLYLFQDYKDSIVLTAKGGAEGAAGAPGRGGSSDYDWDYGFASDGYCSVEGAGGGGGGAGGIAGADIGIGGTQGAAGAKGNNASNTAVAKNRSDGYACRYVSASAGSAGDNSGAKGADKSSVKVIYTLQGITAESKFHALYDDTEKYAEIGALVTDPKNLNVFAYFYKDNIQTKFDAAARTAALNGTYNNGGIYLPTSGENDKWAVWMLDENRYNATVDTSKFATDGKVDVTVAYAPISASVTSDDATNWTAKTTAANVNQVISIALYDNQAKDAAGNVVAGGDAAKFNDEEGLDKHSVKIDDETVKLNAGGFLRKTYVNKAYKFENSTAALSLGALTNTANKTYYVAQIPYYDYEAVATNYVRLRAQNYAALKNLEFLDAGCYLIEEDVTRKYDQLGTGAASGSKTFSAAYYVIIEKADLEIKEASDTVYEDNTKIQDHKFYRYVEGQNSEQVYGTFTFASEVSDKWGNDENLTVGSNTPILKDLNWEFNVYETEYVDTHDATINGKRNVNNYLCQFDGKSAADQAKDTTVPKPDYQNTYYMGANGIVAYTPEGTINVREAELELVIGTEPEQKEAPNLGTKTLVADLEQFTIGTATEPLTGVYAEDVDLNAEVVTADLGWRVVKGDAVTGSATSGTHIKSAADLPEDYQAYYDKLVASDAYLGDLYIVTVKAGDETVDTFYINDETAANTVNNVASKIEKATDKLPACEFYGVDYYDVTVDYIGLYYTTETSTDGRKADWSGQEEFNWATATKSFKLDIAQRDVALKTLTDLDKIYDGSTYLVKQTLTGDDVTAAEQYIIDLDDATASATQFAKKPIDIFDNYLVPADVSNHMTIELAGTYADKDKGADKTVTLAAARLLHYEEISDTNETTIPAAGDEVCALNYNLDATLPAGTGDIAVAAMHLTHAQYGSSSVRDITPMHELFGLSAKAYLLTTVTDGVEDEENPVPADGFYDVLEMTNEELIEADDAKKDATFPTATTEAPNFDYKLSYKINLNTKYKQYFEGSTLVINENTGAVEATATNTLGGTNPTNFPAMDITVSEFKNFTLKTQTETETSTFNECTKNGANTNDLTESGENWTHIMRFKIVANSNSYDVLLPVNQLNARAVETPASDYTPSTFTGRTGGNVASDGESYDYICLYPNDDSITFNFTIPQDSYLEDIKIVAVKVENDEEEVIPYKTLTNDTYPVPAFETLLADETNVIGTFTTQAETDTGMNNIANPLTLALAKVNGVDVASLAATDYFGGTLVGDGYTATALAEANEQIGGSTFSFTLTTGECELGANYAIAIIPVVKAYDALLDTTGAPVAPATEIGRDSSAANYLTVDDTDEGTVTIGFTTLLDVSETNGDFGKVTMTYGDSNSLSYTSSAVLSADAQTITFAEAGNTTFFDPTALLPGTVVDVTVNVWRNGAVAGVQAADGATDLDLVESITYKWTVTKADYDALFADDLVKFVDGSTVIGYAAVPGSGKLDFAAVQFIGADSTKDLKNYTKSDYTVDGWFTDSGLTTEVSYIDDTAEVSVVAGDDFYLKSTYVGGSSTPSAPREYDVVIPETIENGAVESDKDSATAGEEVTLTVTPDEGYKLDSIKVTDRNGEEVELTDLGDGKYSFEMPAGKVNVEATFAEDKAVSSVSDCPRSETCVIEKFTDTTNDEWWHDGIHYCVENGIMNGVADTLFDPEGNATRAMIVTMLWRVAGEPESDYEISFEDVEDGEWYTEAVRWAQSTEVILGYDDTTFGTEDPITREQLATIIYRYAKLVGIDTAKFTENVNTLSFDDVFDISDWATEGMHFCIASGILMGDNGVLYPQNDATRAEIAVMFQRFCENVLEK